MPVATRGPMCGISNPVWASTPGPTGHNDSADPARPVKIPVSRRVAGAIELSESGRTVLAQNRGGTTPLPASKILDEPACTPGHMQVDLPTEPLLPRFMADEITADEVEQGDLSDCTVPAVLAAMANTEIGRKQIHAIVQFDERAIVHSKWSRGDLVSPGLVTIALQSGSQEISRLLYREGADLLFARSKNGAGWVSFIEKAFAAKKGGYQEIAHIGVAAVMRDLTGTEPIHTQLRSAEKGKLLLDSHGIAALRTLLARATLRPTVAATPDPKVKATFNTASGLLASHAYAVLGFKASGKTPTVNLLDCGTQVAMDLALSIFLTDFSDVVAMPG